MNDRAKRRLELARDILRMDPNAMPSEVLTAIRAKEKKEQDSLRSIADWLEDYEKHEEELVWGRCV